MSNLVTFPRSLQFRMTCVVVMLVLIATMIVTWLALVLAERDMRSVIGNQQYALLSSSAAQLDAQITFRKTLLASLADTLPAQAADAPAALKAFVDSHPVVRNEFLTLFIFNRQGMLVHTYGQGSTMPVPNAQVLADLRRILAEGKPVVSPPYRSTVTGRPSITMLHPVLDSAGHGVMLLGGSIDLTSSSFLQQVAAQKPGKTGFIFIMTRNGVLLHHPDAGRLLENINDRPGQNRATQMALQGFEGWTVAANKDGSEGIYSYRHLATTGWIIGARFPVDEAFAPMIAMRRHALVGAAAFAVLAGLAAWLLIRILLRPLDRLHRSIGDIRSGKADIDVLQRRRRDEIGALGRAFHELIAERVAAQRHIADSEKRLKLLTDNLPVLISYLDLERRIQFLNATFRNWFGTDPHTLIGHHLRQGIGAQHYHTAEPHLDKAYHGQAATCELKATIDDCLHTLETTFLPDLAPDGRVLGVYSLTHDTTRMKEIEERLKQLARVDTLTGIANRLMFEEILQLAVVRARRSRKPLALAYLDIDYFKVINDSEGHGAGDEVLKEFAARLAGSVRASDSVARLAGDEFVIVFEQVAGPDELRRLAVKIIEAIRRPFTVAGVPRRITTSVGLALHEGDHETPADLVARADSALYAAKRAGRDGYKIAD